MRWSTARIVMNASSEIHPRRNTATTKKAIAAHPRKEFRLFRATAPSDTGAIGTAASCPESVRTEDARRNARRTERRACRWPELERAENRFISGDLEPSGARIMSEKATQENPRRTGPSPDSRDRGVSWYRQLPPTHQQCDSTESMGRSAPPPRCQSRD